MQVRTRMRRLLFGVAALAVLHPAAAAAQTAANLATLQGLSPLTTLLDGAAGQAALMENLAVTAAIQTGAARQPILLPFAEQQQLALRDAFITAGNATQLADGLGTRLGAAYQAKASYQDRKTFTSVGPATAQLFAYTNATTASDSNAGKYFFANGTMDGRLAASDAAAAIILKSGGVTDVFGKAYRRPAGSPGADQFGNSRPFQTEPDLLPIDGPGYFGEATSNRSELSGPATDLRDSPSFPSGHTTYGTMESLLLALLVPDRFQQMNVRGAEYANNRIILGAHYAMDVIAGRTLALHDVAHLLANDPRFVGMTKAGVTLTDYPAALAAARAELSAVLQAACGEPVPACAARDTGRFADPAALRAMIGAVQTYGLPVVYPDRAARKADIGREAPEAGHLLTAAFPYLTLDQANAILTETQGPGGGFLDNGSVYGVYSRLDLVAAGQRAAALAPTH